jgi:ATP-dependent RNA helicase SUPV3L1/SUV3
MVRSMDGLAAHGRVLAVLGPTNTGKTHLAIERMLGHASGMIGFPLRLLARENYDRVVKAKGRTKVALVTGEEKIIPSGACYFVCTVESMPLDREVDFLAVDEIQLCADRERGHVFTHRLMHARGAEETMFMGAETIRPLLRRLVPQAEFTSRARFSSLLYTGPRKPTRLPPRSAVVAFSATDVYHLGELMRRQRGGCAVVLGALSPRTRNAQVGMYQAGEVDYLVATDAIGMGLNMDIDHVAFARLGKFDGRSPRPLRAPEIAQIAGRAGRHMNDGTFGTTSDVGEIDEEIVEAVESHSFEPLTHLMWRNTDLDFRSPQGLLKSLDERPPYPFLRRGPEAEDQLSLAVLAREPDVAAMAANPETVRLLWEVCQIPDFTKTLTDAHTRLLAGIYRQLMARSASLETDWVAGQVKRLDRTDGDIDALVMRIAHIRTWTYIAYRGRWLADPRHWQQRARAIEDKLSDALHERLTQRFVDKRSAALVKGLKGGGELLSAVARSGEVLVEGEYIGRLDGFRFSPDAAVHSEDARALLSAARRALRREIAARVRRFEEDGDEAFSLGDPTTEQWNTVLWHGGPVAKLAPGPTVLEPAVRPTVGDLVETAARDRLARRLKRWLDGEIAAGLAPLVRLRDAKLAGPARGIAYQLVEGLGSRPAADLAPLAKTLGKADAKRLAALGVRFGRAHVFLQPALKPRVQAMRGLLWAVANRLIVPPAMPRPGAPSVVRGEDVPDGFYPAIGYWPVGRRAVRLDRLEALADAAATAGETGPFAPDPQLAQLVGATRAELPEILTALGWRVAVGEDGGVTVHPAPAKKRGGKPRRPRIAADSPFAKLRALEGGRSSA